MRLALINQIDTLARLVHLADTNPAIEALINSTDLGLLRQTLSQLQAAEVTMFTATKTIDDLMDNVNLKNAYDTAVAALAGSFQNDHSSLVSRAPNFRYSTSVSWPSVSWRKTPASIFITEGTCGCNPAADP